MKNGLSHPFRPGIRKGWGVALLLTACACCQQVMAQPFQVGPGPQTADTVSLGFERLWNTFVWRGNLGLVFADSDNLLILHQVLRSKLVRTSPVATQGEYDGDIRYQRRIATDLSLLVRTSSLVVSDNQSVDLSRLAQHSGLMGLEYGVGSWNLAALGGFEVDAQQDTRDEGLAFDALLQNPALRFEQIDAMFQSRWTKSFLGARNPEQRYAGLSLVRDFGGGDTDSLSVEYMGQRREFYTSADPSLQSLYSVTQNIFRRDETNLNIGDELLYHMGWHSAIRVRGSLQSRTIDRAFLYKNYLQPSSITLDTRIQELFLNGSITLLSRPFEWLGGEAGMTFEERDARFSVQDVEGIPSQVYQSQEESAKKLENTSQRTTMWGSLVSDFSQTDVLKLSGSASILRYDTPDSLNTDDRDELLFTLSTEENHTFNEYLSAGISASVTLNHLVYLDRLQSANNNWNRVLSLAPSVLLTPASWIRSDNEAEVVANYTVYDFEQQVASVKSFSFRQASWSDSTVIGLTRRVGLSFSGMVRLYERGILKWQEFKEKPLDYFVEELYWPQLSYRTREDIVLTVGYRYFSRDQFSYEGSSRSLSHTLVTAGPTAGIEWYGSNGTNVVVNGWRESSATDSASPTYVSNLSVSVRFIF